MQTAGGGFAAAVTAQDQLIDHKLTIGFPVSVPSYYQDVTKCVVSVYLDAAVTTTLPDGTTLISGYPSAAMTVVLAGMLNQAPGVPLVESDNIFKMMNPNDSTSAMWRTTRGGLPITWQAGLWDGAAAADLVTQYTGTIDQVTCSNGQVTIVCRDQRSTVTSQASLPPVVTNAPYNAYLTGEFPTDWLLRHSSPAQYLSWPAIRSSCVFAASLRGSIWPEVGQAALYTTNGLPPAFFAPGVFGSGLTGDPNSASPFVPYQTIVDWQMPAGVAITGSQPIFFEYFGNFSTVDPGSFGTNAGLIQWSVGDQFDAGSVSFTALPALGEVKLSVQDTAGSHATTTVSTPALTAGDHYVSGLITWTLGSATVNYVIKVDTTVYTGSWASGITRQAMTMDFVGGEIFGFSVASGLQVTTESAPASNASFAPTLIIDPAGSLNSLTALPDVSGKDVWTVLQEIAAAESAVIGFDELGKCRFVNRNTIRAMTVARSITSSKSLVSLDSLEQMSLCATHIQVPVNQVQIAPYQIVWQSSTPLQVNPGTPLVIIATMDNPAVNVPTHDSGFLPSTTWLYQNAYWMGCTTPDGTGLGIGSAVSFTVQQLSATQLKITVTNTNTDPVFLVAGPGQPTPPGTPVLIIGGQPILSVNNQINNNSVAVDGVTGGVIADAQYPDINNGGAISNAQFGEILLQLSANDWVQSIDDAQTLANDLLRDLYSPKPLYRNVSIIPDPRLQLLDKVTLVDPDVSQINDDALIVGMTKRLSAGEYSQVVDARAAHRPGAWLLGVAGRSELGVTTYLY